VCTLYGRNTRSEKTEEYFAGKEIVFVSISIDNQKESWKKMIEEKEMRGVQLFADDPNDPFIKAYDVQGIPRFILLDRKGKIIDPNITRPSDEDLIPLIEANL